MKRVTRRIALASLAAFGGSAALRGLAAAADPPFKLKLHTAVNPKLYTCLPVIIAFDRGYFTAEGLDVTVDKFSSSTILQLPNLVHGSLDAVDGVAGPALYNQVNEGFDIKCIAAVTIEKVGWHDELWVMVRKDLWDSGQVRKLADIKGRHVDGATPGSPINLLTNEMIVKAGYTKADVQYTERLRDLPDMIAGLRNKAVDVVAAIEPAATEMVENGYGERLVSATEITPGMQSGFVIASSKAMAANRPAFVAFLKACVRAQLDLVKTGPKFSAETLRSIKNWSEVSDGQLAQMLPPYFGMEPVNAASLSRPQDLWLAQNLVSKRVDVASMIDNSLIIEARKQLHLS